MWVLFLEEVNLVFDHFKILKPTENVICAPQSASLSTGFSVMLGIPEIYVTSSKCL